MAAQPSAPSPAPAHGNPRLPLLALGAAAFGIGTTEFVIMGLLPQVAGDLHVTIPEAGLLVTGYALSVTFGSPFLAVATARMDRRRALLVLMGVFILGNLMCALAPSYWLLMGARVLTALCHGAFFGLGAVVASALVLPGRKAQAIAMMFAGLTLANVLGVPAGTALGEALGWRSPFFVVVAIGIAAALALAAFLPRTIEVPPMNLKREAKSLGSPQVMLAMALSIVSSASLFSVFTYITPILQNVTGISTQGVTLMLLLFGVGLTCGNFLGGRLADWRLMPSVIGIMAVIVPLLASFAATSHAVVPAALTLFIWGVLAFALIAPLQTRVVTEAAKAPNLASTLNQGAFNFGNAIGAWAGGLALTAGLPYADLPFMGAAIAVAGLALAVLSYALDLKAQRDAATDAAPAAGRP
ncbi:MFS transporter [Xanthobacter autotrophicus]|uniref:MFS transporter n=1 Tax=Xanthobacter TaxID=279 RepID=UPI0024AADCD5|nr:MFS transporter [Xanthobacter autotrophicus]MDI4664242.1 MFS transporter [Xanthobacter autotrophicus]